ncbi:MAG: tRNA pseudouridine(55) synthase TruB [Phycisphaeraceae bacterium]|nr:tRNA pseudouridine(55) synthase TruB [Phycisphaeraceae bacterium]
MADVPPLQGVIVIDKPVGPTSMRVVERVRRAAGGARCGHAGTLDPLASGVLVVALGRATRQIEALMAGPKRYETEVDLSATTATLDSEGELQPVRVECEPSRDDLERALATMRGTFAQRPPAFSAVKIGGRRAYALARRGAAEEPPPRSVTVHELEIDDFRYPLVRLRIRCDKGFYVRSLARDLGLALGTGGYCRSIRRTAVEPYTLSDALPLDELPERLGPEHLLSCVPGSGGHPGETAGEDGG